jgi:FixJ family two-component response regulator
MERFECLPFYHPTTVVLVDDEVGFLQNLALELDPDIAFRIFESPRAVLETVGRLGAVQVDLRYFRELTGERTHPHKEHVIGLDLAAIHRQIFNGDRFDKIAVVVADYDMPGIDGLELFRRIGSGALRKILLTGKADEKIAVAAFNEGLIDRFVRKHEPETAKTVNRYIHDLQREYFQSFASMVTRTLAVETPSFLHDPAFAEHFQNICEEREVAEFYLTANPTGFLLVDRNARAELMVVQTREDLNLQAEIAEDQEAPGELLASLKQGAAIAHFPRSGGFYQQGDAEWRKRLFSAQVFHGREPYYYAFVDEVTPYEVSPSTVRPYSNHLADLDTSDLTVPMRVSSS